MILARSIRVWGLKSNPPPPPTPPHPLIPQVMSTLGLHCYGWQWKNPLLFSIIWIGSRWCKSWHSLNFVAYSGGFLVALFPHPPIYWHSCSGTLKVFRWHIPGPSFIYVWFSVLEFWNFNCFHTSRKHSFRLFLGSFLDVTHGNVVKFVWNLDQWYNAL